MCFEDMGYRNLDPDKGLQLDGITTEEEEEKARKMIIVSIWCIQINPSDRPSMSKAIEMLEGSLELLPIPPKRSLSSPSASPRNFEITSLSSTFTNSKSHQGQEPRGGKSYASV
ncbi:uncharacterized protein J3R85_007424 [Psidium guajava]|nr:uncharacterized protein J3R85_007424 [Psidium guajava]